MTVAALGQRSGLEHHHHALWCLGAGDARLHPAQQGVGRLCGYECVVDCAVGAQQTFQSKMENFEC